MTEQGCFHGKGNILKGTAFLLQGIENDSKGERCYKLKGGGGEGHALRYNNNIGFKQNS